MLFFKGADGVPGYTLGFVFIFPVPTLDQPPQVEVGAFYWTACTLAIVYQRSEQDGLESLYTAVASPASKL